MRRLVFFAFLTIGISVLGQNAGQIGHDQSICYGSAPQSLIFTSQPSGGTVPYLEMTKLNTHFDVISDEDYRKLLNSEIK